LRSIRTGKFFGFFVAHCFDTLLGEEMVLDPEALAIGVDPLVGVRSVAVHVTPGAREAAVAHEVGHLVSGLR
jgi:hypothetical protein